MARWLALKAYEVDGSISFQTRALLNYYNWRARSGGKILMTFGLILNVAAGKASRRLSTTRHSHDDPFYLPF